MIRLTKENRHDKGNGRHRQLCGEGYDSDGDGWLFFAGTILGLAGLMRIFDSIWAFRYKGALPEGLKDGLVGSNLKNYAWLWLIVGIVLLIASFLVLSRSQFARWVGLFAAGIGGLSAIVWMPYTRCGPWCTSRLRCSCSMGWPLMVAVSPQGEMTRAAGSDSRSAFVERW